MPGPLELSARLCKLNVENPPAPNPTGTFSIVAVLAWTLTQKQQLIPNKMLANTIYND